MTPDLLTVRDWFAGMAMQTLMADLAKSTGIHVKTNTELKQAILAKVSAAYDWAEVMMTEREKRASSK
jgi:hypothetical protein